ncbi:MAG: NmrA family transcriptional regulator [Gammaproteobacteria bacterium]
MTEQTNIANSDLTLVVGGTGKIGGRIVERLETRGVATRAASRSTGFDWHDPTTWDAVLENVAIAYISYAPDLAVPGAAEAIRLFAQKAVEAGVSRLVLLSGRGEAEAQRCERIVQAAGVDWTIVRASWFQQNFSEGEFVEQVLAGEVTLPAGDVREPFIDADDIADVAVAALTGDGHAGEVYEVTGPQLMTFAEAVQEIAAASGRDVRYVRVPHDAFVAGIAGSGAPAEMAWLLDYLFAQVLDGRNAHLTDGVQRALGREPTDFAEYARRAAASGVWDTAPARAVGS